MEENKLLKSEYTNKLLERFLKYVKTCSQSSEENAEKGIMPSTQDEWNMSEILVAELNGLGLENVLCTKNCYTYGFLPASAGLENEKPFCLLAHIDTVDKVSGENVKPLIHENYQGQKIELSPQIILDSSDKYLKLAAEEKDTIITASGDTLLGADDKAGVSEIITALEFIISHPEIKHGPIEVIFSPDEETGHGMDKVPLEILKSKYAYTVDGGHIGELETECFNAFKSEIWFYGKSVHTGSARGVMINAVTMASAFLQNLPKNEAPETTDNYQGFYAPMSVEGSIEEAKVNLLLRDFTMEGMEKRKATVDSIAQMIEKTSGGKVKTVHTQQYLNMKNELDKNPSVVENLVNAYKKADITPEFVPIRGGTDGSRLTEMGIPCPNIFTGGHNFHSRYEWASLTQMCKATEVLINLMSKSFDN